MELLFIHHGGSGKPIDQINKAHPVRGASSIIFDLLIIYQINRDKNYSTTL